jgi:pyridoxal phosphate enzyme (YggS family)
MAFIFILRRNMAINTDNYNKVLREIGGKATLVAVSKTKPVEDIRALYEMGQRDFGENYVQELVEKQPVLPGDTRWHYIGHLQSNKVKYIAPFVHLIHGVDSLKLLKEINKQAQKNGRVIDCLLQVHVAQEETKFGLDEKEINEIVRSGELNDLKSIKVKGMMGMATFTEDIDKVREEFKYLKSLFDMYNVVKLSNFELTTLSMGMSADYKLAIQEGSNMVRIGSLLFGERN